MIKEFLSSWIAIGGTSILSSVLTYLFAKRKYNTEADSTEIDNLKKSVEVYQTIIEDLKIENRERKLEFKELRQEFAEMKKDFEAKLKKARENC